MRIGITTFGLDGGRSGMSRYLLQLLPEFAQADGEFEILVLSGERAVFDIEPDRIGAVEIPDRWAHPVANVAWHQWGLDRICRQRGYDALFIPAGNRRVPLRCPCPTVGTVHDFAHLHVESKYDAARTLYQDRVLPYMIRKLDRIITDSQSGKDDIVTHVGVPDDLVSVIPLAADTEQFKPGDRSVCAARMGEKYGFSPPYVFYVSRLEHPAKNHVRLIQAFDRLKTAGGLPHTLVLAGSDWHGAAEVHAAAASAASSEYIVFTGFMDQEDLPKLHSGADAFVFPSLFEGFGLGILEAMACNTPVACANVSSIPEVAGQAAILFDPYDVDAIAAAMGRLLTDPHVREEYARLGLARAAEFSWNSTAKKTLEVIKSVI